jgi:hypothetical protein
LCNTSPNYTKDAFCIIGATATFTKIVRGVNQPLPFPADTGVYMDPTGGGYDLIGAGGVTPPNTRKNKKDPKKEEQHEPCVSE